MARISDVDPNEAIARLAETYTDESAAEPARQPDDSRVPAPSRVATLAEVERRLWSAADQLRANSNLKSSEYSTPVLGLIFLRYADVRFAEAERQLAAQATGRTKDTYLAAQFHRLAARLGRKQAAVAVGHTILVIAYHLLEEPDSAHRDLGVHYFDHRDHHTLKRRLLHRLEGLGYKVTPEPADPAA